MALRKASSYSKKHVVPFTRISKLKSRSYIKTVPPQKIVKFYMGIAKNTFPHRLRVLSEHRVQIRDNALEACRQFIHKQLDTGLAGQYYFRVIHFPHHIQRENKMLTGAGADRMSSGMAHSFGQSIGIAAQVKKDARLFSIFCNEQMVPAARKILDEARIKIPGRKTIIVEKVE